jgi:hypothetical protein
MSRPEHQISPRWTFHCPSCGGVEFHLNYLEPSAPEEFAELPDHLKAVEMASADESPLLARCVQCDDFFLSVTTVEGMIASPRDWHI